MLIEGVADGHPEAQVVDGFGDVVVGPELDGIDGAVNVAVTR